MSNNSRPDISRYRTNLPNDLARTSYLRLRIAIAIWATAGISYWIGIGNGRGIGEVRWILIGIAGAAACLPPVARIITAFLDHLRYPATRTMNRTALLIGIVSTAYFILTAFNQDRDLFPKTHDDCSYAIGIQMLARGRLWGPALPLPNFFDSFYLLTRPVYCSIYFPGTALLYVPTGWLHLPSWLMPAMASGAVVGMMYRITSELIDGASGLLAALIVSSLSWFRVYSVLLTGHVPMLLMGLLLVFAWMRWRSAHQIRWAAAIGVFAGWAAITRPADAVIYALPIGIAMLWEISRRRSMRAMLAPVIIVVAAMPFLTLQIIFNIGVTGRALRTPYTSYLEQDQPGSSFGFHAYNADNRPRSPLIQKQENYARWVRPYLARHTPAKTVAQWAGTNVPMISDVTMPVRLMLVFVPIGLLGLKAFPRWILFSTLPLFVIVYAFNPFFLEHYALLIIPAVVLTVLLGGNEIAAAWPRWQSEIRAAFAAIIVVACMTSFWEINRVITSQKTRVSDETFPSDYLRNVHLYLPALVDSPAVVLFRFHPGDDYFQEPVYNTDVPWPDDSSIIRAHDLGPIRNREIFGYYANTQPDRTFYIFDWAERTSKDGPLRRLGTARELASQKKP